MKSRNGRRTKGDFSAASCGLGTHEVLRIRPALKGLGLYGECRKTPMHRDPVSLGNRDEQPAKSIQRISVSMRKYQDSLLLDHVGTNLGPRDIPATSESPADNPRGGQFVLQRNEYPPHASQQQHGGNDAKKNFFRRKIHRRTKNPRREENQQGRSLAIPKRPNTVLDHREVGFLKMGIIGEIQRHHLLFAKKRLERKNDPGGSGKTDRLRVGKYRKNRSDEPPRTDPNLPRFSMRPSRGAFYPKTKPEIKADGGASKFR